MKEISMVNWANGMKMSAGHFVDMENALWAGIVKTNKVHTGYHSYGILEPDGNFNEGLDYSLKELADGRLELSLSNCSALTPGGLRIDIGVELAQSLFQNVEVTLNSERSNTQEYFLIMRVSIINRLPYGDLDNNEVPLRHPWSFFGADFFMVDEEELNGEIDFDSIVIFDKYEINNGKFVGVKGYIPPSASLSSFEALRKLFEGSLEYFQKLDGHSGSVAKKAAENPSPLADNIKLISEKVVSFVSALHFRLNNITMVLPPVFLIKEFAALASEFRVFLLLLGDKEKEDFFKYLEEWTKYSPADMQETIKAVLGLTYMHRDLSHSIGIVQDFMEKTLKIYEELDSLKFIGERNQSLGVVYNRDKTKKGPKQKQGIFSPIRR